MTRPDTLTRFATAVDLALTLPHPTEIYRAIMSGSSEVDDGLKGTSYDSDRTTGGTSSSHPERMLARKHPGQFPKDAGSEKYPDWEDEPGTWGARTDRARDDLLHLRRATDRVLDAVSALVAECIDAGTPDDWEDALKAAHTLHDAGYLAAAIDVGRNVDGWALRFIHGIDTVRAIRDSWMAHTLDASDLGLVKAHRWCRSHERVKDAKGKPLEKARDTALLCRWCYRHVEDLAEFSDETAVELQRDPKCWPSEAMVAADEQGRRVLYDKEEAAWQRSHGLDPAAVHQRRQGRRAG